MREIVPIVWINVRLSDSPYPLSLPEEEEDEEEDEEEEEEDEDDLLLALRLGELAPEVESVIFSKMSSTSRLSRASEETRASDPYNILINKMRIEWVIKNKK